VENIVLCRGRGNFWDGSRIHYKFHIDADRAYATTSGLSFSLGRVRRARHKRLQEKFY